MADIPISGAGTSPALTCGACRLADRCGAAGTAAPGPLRGADLVLASLLHFLLPAVLALAGAAAGGGGWARQLTGGLAGMLLGMLIAILVARRRAAVLDRRECHEPR